VVTLQNGVEAPFEVAEAVGRDAALPGVARIFAALDGPGRVRHIGGPASLAFAEWDNRDSARLDRLRAALGEAGVAVETPRRHLDLAVGQVPVRRPTRRAGWGYR
jgi:2-dehydropantoate 2-reductase